MGKITGLLMFILAIASVMLFVAQPLMLGSVLWWFQKASPSTRRPLTRSSCGRSLSWESASPPRSLRSGTR